MLQVCKQVGNKGIFVLIKMNLVIDGGKYSA